LESEEQLVFFEKSTAAISENLELMFFSNAVKFFLEGVGKGGVLFLMFSDIGGEQLDILIEGELVHVIEFLEIVDYKK
jgi:hypothetical protein